MKWSLKNKSCWTNLTQAQMKLMLEALLMWLKVRISKKCLFWKSNALLMYSLLLWYQFWWQIIFKREWNSLASSLLNIICRQILYQSKSDYMDRAWGTRQITCNQSTALVLIMTWSSKLSTVCPLTILWISNPNDARLDFWQIMVANWSNILTDCFKIGTKNLLVCIDLYQHYKDYWHKRCWTLTMSLQRLELLKGEARTQN